MAKTIIDKNIEMMTDKLHLGENKTLGTPRNSSMKKTYDSAETNKTPLNLLFVFVLFNVSRSQVFNRSKFMLL